MPYLVSNYLQVLLQGKGIEMSETLPDLLSIEKVRSGRERNCMLTVIYSDIRQQESGVTTCETLIPGAPPGHMHT